MWHRNSGLNTSNSTVSGKPDIEDSALVFQEATV